MMQILNQINTYMHRNNHLLLALTVSTLMLTTVPATAWHEYLPRSAESTALLEFEITRVDTPADILVFTTLSGSLTLLSVHLISLRLGSATKQVRISGPSPSAMGMLGSAVIITVSVDAEGSK